MAATAARAPAMVVMQGTPWLTAAARMRPSSVRAPLPLGVLTIRSMVAVGQVVEQVGAALADLADRVDVDAMLEQRADGPAGSDQAKTHGRESRAIGHNGLAIACGDAHKHGAA